MSSVHNLPHVFVAAGGIPACLHIGVHVIQSVVLTQLIRAQKPIQLVLYVCLGAGFWRHDTLLH